jgi:Na+/glutamate symporter
VVGRGLAENTAKKKKNKKKNTKKKKKKQRKKKNPKKNKTKKKQKIKKIKRTLRGVCWCAGLSETFQTTPRRLLPWKFLSRQVLKSTVRKKK